MEIVELILGYGGLAAVIGAFSGIPVSYGIFVREGTEVEWKKLPLVLRFFYDYTNVQNVKKKGQRRWKYPELFTFVPLVLFIGYLGFKLLELDAETGAIQINTNGIVSFVIFGFFLLFWWIVFTLGTELWLKHKWIPRHTVSENSLVNPQFK